WRARTIPSAGDEWAVLDDEAVEIAIELGLNHAEARSSVALQDLDTQLKAIVGDRNAWRIRAAGGEVTPETAGMPVFDGQMLAQTPTVSGPLLITIDGTPEVWGVPSPRLTPSARQDL